MKPSLMTALPALLAGATLAWPTAALAVRPTSGGTFHFEADDVVESWDEPTGLVRVHYSVDGPSQTRMDDDDGDGIPDFAQDIATTTAAVLDMYADLGLRYPITEEEMGLSELGGSYAYDVYLLEFDHMGDGAFGVDSCSSAPDICSGFLMIENDFSGYGYGNLDTAVDVLTSHELFHGVQYAYDSNQSVWFTEGTATWGERQWDEDSYDFMGFADEYLEDTGRSLDSPPTGPVPAWAYGTCLWWDFLTLRHDPEMMAELQLATETMGEPVDTLVEMEQVILDYGDTLEEAWFQFTIWNLATGYRAGATESYPYANRLRSVDAEDVDDSIDDDNRFYPLAATYYRLEHDGGPIWFGIEEDAPGLYFALLPVAGGEDDGPVEDPVDTWIGEEAISWALADGQDFPAGGYWLVGSQAGLGDNSIKVRICLGSEETAAECAAPAAGDDDDDDSADDDDDDDEGCSCSSAGNGRYGSLGLLLLLGLLGQRRRA